MREFKIDVPQSQLDDLKRRLADTRWPGELPDVGWSRGAPLSYIKELAEYWRTSYDWRAAEAQINEFPQFITEIDGEQVHFLHVRSAEPNAMPLLLTHGWPGTFVEFLHVIDPLVNPTAHGAGPEDAFHVIVPTIPGFGFSGQAKTAGWKPERLALAWKELMRSLGYTRYMAQGGDFGMLTSLRLGLADPEHVAGVHINTVVTLPPPDPAAMAALMAEMSEADMAALQFAGYLFQDGFGFMKIQATRPQTLSYGLTDSPVGQLAWIAEKFKEWTDSTDRPEDAVDRDHLLTNISVYWLTATAGSSAQLYYDSEHLDEDFGRTWAGPWPLTMPVGAAVFPKDVARPIRSWAENIFPSLSHWTEFDRGGHFPAMEQPKLLVNDVRAFARTLR